jgi:hypothetical protein
MARWVRSLGHEGNERRPVAHVLGLVPVMMEVVS